MIEGEDFCISVKLSFFQGMLSLRQIGDIISLFLLISVDLFYCRSVKRLI